MSETSRNPAPRGRYAPSPTGLTHVGSARTALVAWLSVRNRGGTFVWRLEDLDPPRVVEGMAAAALDDLAWLGLDWDEGPSIGGPHAPYVQSQRSEHYQEALRRLAKMGRLFPCRHSRKDLRNLASAPGDTEERSAPYPTELRPHDLDDDWLEQLSRTERPDAALRFLVDEAPIHYRDRVQGELDECVIETVGDFVLKRRDGLYAYQLAVVVDDMLMGIDDVVRGSDLMDSTARQVQLIEALGGSVPEYAHVPLVITRTGEKLSASEEALTLRALRASGVAAEQLVGYFAYSLGLCDSLAPCRPADLIAGFSWSRMTRMAWAVPNDLADRIKRIA